MNFKTIRCLIAFTGLTLLTGCYEVHQGYYEASNVPGWKKRVDVGGNFFNYPIKNAPDWFIQLGSTSQKSDSLHIRMGSDTFFHPDAFWSVVSFSSEPVRIICHDQNEREIVAVDSSRWAYEKTISLEGSTNFTVIVPSFKIGTNTVPELSARFRWTDKKYYIEVPPIQ
ncbi:MAG TPA: hypothetical protein VFV23_05460 [Verrucomicrobiae bacterium]|nr:hypothetical protein [Verrucomicrobiae bacterium]